VGGSPSIIAASWQALTDSIEYGLWIADEKKRRKASVAPGEVA
jgi:hypothetical protein